MTAVVRKTIHHEGVGAPDDSPRGAAGGYSVWIGPTTWTFLRPPDISFATYGYNHVSMDICLSGNRMEWPVLDTELALITDAVASYVLRDWVTSTALTYPHGTLYPPPPPYPSGSSPSQCPGILTIDRWPDVVRAASPGVNVTPTPPNIDITGARMIARTSTGKGYWIVDSTGAVFAYGDAKYHGGANGGKLNAPITGIAATPDDGGYWLLAQDGGVFAYGDAVFYGAPTGQVH